MSPWGMEFRDDGLGKSRGCANKCVFCFVDQLPPGMRESLYFKDDDWRLSFIMGNYVTLTNLSDAEFKRILARKVSPLYISVHATDDEVRARLIRCPRGSGIMDKLARLKDAGIRFHCQAVLCKGINDGPVLEKTIADLCSLQPFAASLALVPVGLTRHREGLAALEPMDGDAAALIIDIAEKWQKKLLSERGGRFVFCADELYIRAGRPFPSAEEYEDFAQIEDGVGLVTQFMQEVEEALSTLRGKPRYSEVSIATGVDAAPYIRRAADRCQNKFGVRINVFAVKNRFFGESISVTGLLTGTDIARQLNGEALGECLFLSSSMLKERKNIFLDDMTLCSLSEQLNTECRAVAPDGYSFVSAFLKEEEE